MPALHGFLLPSTRRRCVLFAFCSTPPVVVVSVVLRALFMMDGAGKKKYFAGETISRLLYGKHVLNNVVLEQHKHPAPLERPQHGLRKQLTNV